MISIATEEGGIQIGYTNLSIDIAKIKADSKVFYHVGSYVQPTQILLGGKTLPNTHIVTPGIMGDIYTLTININGGNGQFIGALANKPLQLCTGLVYNYHSDYITVDRKIDGEIVTEYDVLTYKYFPNTLVTGKSGKLEITTSNRASPRYRSGAFGDWVNFNLREAKKSIGFTYTLDVFSFK